VHPTQVKFMKEVGGIKHVCRRVRESPTGLRFRLAFEEKERWEACVEQQKAAGQWPQDRRAISRVTKNMSRRTSRSCRTTRI
jgi:hypothetical protein